jgi:hypothetical protein
MPLGGVWKAGGRRIATNPLKGFPDIAGILRKRQGVFWACELKKPGGLVAPEQHTWIARLKNAGAEVWVAYSLAEFIEQIKLAEQKKEIK